MNKDPTKSLRDPKQSLDSLLSKTFQLHTKEQFVKGDEFDPEAAAVVVSSDSVVLFQRGGYKGISVGKGVISIIADSLYRQVLPQNIQTQNVPWPVKENPRKWLSCNVKSPPGLMEGVKDPHQMFPTGYMPINEMPAYLFVVPRDVRWIKNVIGRLEEFRSE